MLLTNNENALPLYEWLIQKKYKVYIYSRKVSEEQIENMKLDFIISYNYNYLIDKSCIKIMNGNIINLHISYLPWNRGFSPNFWSFIDDTPKGITIHYINEQLDKGNILVQKEYFFDEEKETFKSTYEILNNEIKDLFYKNWGRIESKQLKGKGSSEIGSYHSKRDLENVKSKIKFNWEDNIASVKRRLVCR